MTPDTMVMSIWSENVDKVSVDRGDVIKVTKFKSWQIKLKIGTGMFSMMPDTMAMSILSENDDEV